MKNILLTLLMSILIFSTLNAQNIKLMTEIFPPFQYEQDKKLVGISMEIVKAIQKKIASEDKIKVYSWNRALKILNKKKNTAIFSILRTAQREDKYKWVGPLTSMKLVFFKKKGSLITLKTIEDAKKIRKIGVTKGVANFEILNKQGFKNLDIITSGHDEKNINKLVKGRINLWLSPLMPGLYNTRIQGLGGEIVPIENVVAFSGDMYIAFNKKTDDTIIKKWQTVLDELKKDKEIERIIKKYK